MATTEEITAYKTKRSSAKGNITKMINKRNELMADVKNASEVE